MSSPRTPEDALSSQSPPTTDTISKENAVAPGPNDVFWDGDDDRSNPKNWSVIRRWSHIVMISLLTFITYVAGPIVKPFPPRSIPELRLMLLH